MDPLSPTGTRFVTLTVSEAAIESLRLYAQYHGGAHEDDCPQDDTCDCAHRPLNDAINEICATAFDAQVKRHE